MTPRRTLSTASLLSFCLTALLLVGAFAPPVAHAQKAEGESQVGRISIQPGVSSSSGPGLPANLSMTGTFEEPSGNNFLDAEEEGAVVLRLRNKGQGAGNEVAVWVEPNEPLPDGLTIRRLSKRSPSLASSRPSANAFPVAYVKALESKKDREIRIPLKASFDIARQEVAITVHVTEANGFGPDAPIQFRFSTREFQPPRLAFIDHGIDDQNGNAQIEPTEIVEVTMRIQNTGRGLAEAVKASVEVASSNAFITQNSQTEFTLGDIKASAYEDVSVQVFANKKTDVIPLVLRAEERRGRFGFQDTLRLRLNQPEQDAQVLAVEGRERERPEGVAPSLSIDIREDLPDTPMENPDAVAVVVGIRDYQNNQVPSVKYAEYDASIMRRYLTEVLGYSEENILPRNPNQPMTAGPFRTLIRQKLPTYVRDGSDIFVYFSGHGAPSTTSNPHAYLVPADADPNFVSDDNAYRLTHFYEDIMRTAEEEKAGDVTVVLDACFSGQSGSGEMLIREASPLTLTVESPILAKEGATAFTASANDQVANWYGKKKHGMFTYFFLKGLKGGADLDENGTITVKEMQAYLLDEENGVPYWSQRIHQREQTPQVQTRNQDRVLVRLDE